MTDPLNRAVDAPIKKYVRSPEAKARGAAYRAQYQRDNVEAKREYNRAYHERRKARIAAMSPEDRATVLAEQRAKGRASYRRNKETHLRNAKQRNERFPEERWAARILLTYGLTVERYNEILAEQGGVCAICRSGPKGNTKHLAVDHCHKTGVVRGLLCRTCNVALGQFGDTAEHLQRAADYLKRATEA